MRRGLFSRRRRAPQTPLLVAAREQPSLFADFYEEMFDQVLRYFARETLDPDTAFDLTAETFATAFRDLPGFRGTTADEGYAWFWMIAKRQLYRWREKGDVERAAIARIGLEPLALSDAEFERIEELAEIDSRRPAIAAALDALGADQRDAVRLRVLEEQTYDVVASSLGVTEQVARARVSRGLRRLALLIGDIDDDPVEELQR